MLLRIRVEATRHVLGVRKFYRDSTTRKQDVTETEIPVPWGKVAGKWWGPKDRQPILALHGWQDNAGTFDKLVPCLPEKTSVLAIDLPGHGFSSWSPQGVPYSMLGAVLLLRRIAKYYEWTKIKLMGHSMGSMLIFLYASYFPKEVKFAIGIDLVKPPSIVVNEHCDNLNQQIESMLRTESFTTNPPTYTEEEIIHKWIKGVNYSFDEAGCTLLMKRGVKKVEQNAFSFTKDPRLLKYSSFDSGWTREHILQLAERITCPYRLIKADNSPFFQKKELVLETVEVMSKNSVDFSYTVIPGKHHVHLTHPKRVAEVLNPFLVKYND